MSSPNQYVTEEDKAKGYPFAVLISIPEGKKVDGRRLRKVLTKHGAEELNELVKELVKQQKLFPWPMHLVCWGYGRATIALRDIKGMPVTPVCSLWEFVNNKANGIGKEIQL